jgi:hypothetical protein
MQSRWLVMVAAVGGLLAARPATADELHAKCFVRMIQASHEAGGVDPKITRLRSYLEKPPFTAWKKFTLVDEKDMMVAPNTTDHFDLPNGKKASLTYVDHVLTPEKKHRLRLRLEITDGKGSEKFLNTTFVLDEGAVFLQAGQKLGSGLLVLGFSCDVPND